MEKTKIGDVVMYGDTYFIISEIMDNKLLAGYRLFSEKFHNEMNFISLWNNSIEALDCFWYKPGDPEIGLTIDAIKFSSIDGISPTFIKDMEVFEPGLRPCVWCNFFTDWESTCEKGIIAGSDESGNCIFYDPKD